MARGSPSSSSCWASCWQHPSSSLAEVSLGVPSRLELSLNSHRFYCRIHHVKYVGLDDYFIVVALRVTNALAVQNIFHIRYGTALHLSDLPLDDPYTVLVPTLKYWYAYRIVYPLALLFVKLSFLALYWRNFCPSAVHEGLDTSRGSRRRRIHGDRDVCEREATPIDSCWG